MSVLAQIENLMHCQNFGPNQGMKTYVEHSI